MAGNGDLSPAVTGGQSQPVGGHEPANLGDILERVLDRGLVVVGDIRVSLLDIELLTIKLRLVVASLQTAKQVGIDWWEHDPWFSGDDHDLREENKRLRARLAKFEDRAELEDESEPREAIQGGTRRRADRKEPAKRVKRSRRDSGDG